MNDKQFFSHSTDAARLIRTHAWAETSLGPVDSWPQSLLTLVDVMLGSSHPMFVAWGKEHTLIYNDALIPLLGKNHPSALARNHLDVWHEIRDQLSTMFEQVFTGQPVKLDDRTFVLERNGYKEEATFSFSFTPVRGPSNTIDGIFCAVVETTSQVIAERQLRTLLTTQDRTWQLSPDLMCVMDIPTAVHERVNPAWTKTLGWSKEEIEGSTFMDFAHPDDHAATSNELDTTVDGSPVYNFVNRYRTKSGGWQWISWVAVPEGEKLYVSGRVVTAEKEREQALAEIEATLRQSQKMEAVGQLTGGLAHDFNNLLAGISGSLELMQMRMSQGQTADIERYVTIAKGAVKRAAALTHRLLAFSRRQILAPKPVNVNRLAQGLEELIQRTVGPMIPVELVGSSGAWPVLVDPSQLENALLNLCINARDAMPDGGKIIIETANKWLDVTAAKHHNMPEGQYLSLCVSDTGTGMSPAVIARAFEPFFTTKPIGEGTGLGLSMIYGFAQQSGGQVRIYSEVGKGSTVCIYLPRHYGDVDNSEVAEASVIAKHREQDKTVLVVEDEPTISVIMMDLLEALGYVALQASDSATGLKILQSDARIDLLVTDVGLPGGMNGRQMADAGRALRPGLQILFMTGYAENAILGNGVLQPGMAVLTKPFSLEVMQERIRTMLDKDYTGR